MSTEWITTSFVPNISSFKSSKALFSALRLSRDTRIPHKVNTGNPGVGVGTPANILEAIDRGVDMMDCVMPTRNGRNGMIFTRHGIVNLKNKKWADDFSPLDPGGPSRVDREYSKAYLRHLFVSHEILGMQIASIHNLAFYLWLVKEARAHILSGDFKQWKEEMVVNVTRRL